MIIRFTVHPQAYLILSKCEVLSQMHHHLCLRVQIKMHSHCGSSVSPKIAVYITLGANNMTPYKCRRMARTGFIRVHSKNLGVKATGMVNSVNRGLNNVSRTQLSEPTLSFLPLSEYQGGLPRLATFPHGQ